MKSYYTLFLLFFSFALTQAQIVNIPDTSLKHILTTDNCVDLDNDGIGDSDADTNDDGEIQVSEATAVEYLILDSVTLEMTTILDLTGLDAFVNLKSFNAVRVYFSELQNIDGTNQYVGVETIDFTPFSNMEKIRIADELSSVLTTINASGLTNLTELFVLSVLPEANGEEPIPVVINLQGCNNLINMNLSSSFFDIDFCQIPSLETLRCLQLFSNNKDLNLNCLTNLSTLDVSLNQFNSLYLKNGSVLETFAHYDTFGNLLCIDNNQAELDSLGDVINNFQNVTSTCDGIGGTNMVFGNILINTSYNNDTCETNEVTNPLRFDIMQNNTSVYNFLSTAPDYYETPIGWLGQGDYVIVPTVAFSNGFVVEPEEINVSFAGNNDEMIELDLCMQPRVENVDGIEIKFYPTYYPPDPLINRFDAYIVLSNTNNTSYTGQLRLNFDDDYTSPFDYDYSPSSETDNEVIWDSLTIGANSLQVIWLRIGYNSDTDPSFPVLEGDQLVYDLFLTNLDNAGRSAENTTPSFRMIQTIYPSQEVLDVEVFDSQNSKIKVYPNPTNGVINVKHNEAIDDVSIFSINGQLLYSNTKTRNNSELIELDISNLNQGIYFISVKTNSNVFTKKIIKN